MTLAPYQLSFNGLTIGPGADVQYTQITGLREAPATRGTDVTKARRHGSWAGRTLFNERIVTLDLQVMSGSIVTPGASYESVLAKLAAAFANITEPTGLLPLTFNLSPAWGTARQVVGRPTKGGLPVNADYSYGKALIPVELTCPDPLITDTATQTVSAGLPSPTAGLRFPVAFNASFGASSGGSFQVVNGGNETLYPVWTFTGPITWPSITLGAYSLGFQVTLGATDTLIVDTGAKTAVLNGSSRAGTVISGSQWFGIAPGGGTVAFSSVDSVAVTGTVSGTLPTAAWGWC